MSICVIKEWQGEMENLKKEGKMMVSILIFIYTIHFTYLRSDGRKKLKKKAKWTLASLFSITQYTSPTWRCTQNLKTLAPIEAEKSETEIFIGEKEKWTNKASDMPYVTVLRYTVQFITIKLSTKFQNLNSSICWEIFDKKVSICIL